MKSILTTIIGLHLILLNYKAIAQENNNIKQKISSFFYDNIEYQARLQLSIGGASPMSMPAEIREIESFKPTHILGLEMNATKWINNKKNLGIRAGIKFEGRGMKTRARVKNYYTQIEDDSGAQTKGYFTGHVVTEMGSSYFTIPVLLLWNISPQWNIYGGFYTSRIANKSFSGYIEQGTFREGSPIGELTPFEGDSQGLYDFSNEINPFQWGNQLGAELKTKSNFRAFFDVTMANNPLFKKSFESISFKMYNIYGNLGVAYHF